MDLEKLRQELKQAVSETGAKRDLARIMLGAKPETRVRDLLYARLFDAGLYRPFLEWSAQKPHRMSAKRVDLAVFDRIPEADRARALVEFKAWMGIDVFDEERWEVDDDDSAHSILGAFVSDASKLRKGVASLPTEHRPLLANCTLIYYVRPRNIGMTNWLKYPRQIRNDVTKDRTIGLMTDEFVKRMETKLPMAFPEEQNWDFGSDILIENENVLDHDVAMAAIWWKV